ncbi:hypothetical protein L209DRAFT_755242 [Thermothelomyces heterothallicus CBS 203.75]
MCTYDYTPYTGCEDGPQHYYIQWVKCDVAVERGRYCSLDASQKVEQLRKLSVNVLSCPLHGPIAVQQFVLEAANARLPEKERERSRARSNARRGPASRGRTPRRGPPDTEAEEPVRRQVRKRRSRREIAVGSSDSELSDASSSSRRRVDGWATRSGHQDAAHERRTTRNAQPHGHRRSASADAGAAIPSHPPPPLSMRHGKSEVSLPLKTGFGAEGKEDDQGSTTGRRQSRPRNSLDTGRAALGIVGLPSSPDMHRRGSIQRAKSELGLKPGVDSAPEPMPASKSAVSPASDSSPDQNPDLPFSTPGRLGRRTGTRSIRDRSVDTTMRRIDEDVAQDENTAATQDTAASTTLSLSTTGSSAPQQQGQDAHSHRRSNSRPRLNSLQIPPVPQRQSTSNKYQQEAYSAPTAIPPETDLNLPSPTTRQHRAGSLRHIDLPSPTTTTNIQQHSPPTPRFTGGDGVAGAETASIRSARSSRRCLADQVAEARKWAAAREHLPAPPSLAARPSMSETSLPLPPSGPAGPAGERDRERGSVDSGYLSGGGHHHQAQHPRPHQKLQHSPHYIPPEQLWNRGDVARATAAASAGGASGASPTEASSSRGGGGGGGKLQKAPPPLPQPGQGRQQQQQQQQQSVQEQWQGLGLGLVQGAGGGPQQQQRQQQQHARPVPAPLNLANSGSGTGMPASLASPGLRSDTSVDGGGSIGKGAKATLLQRMGLRRKFSGLISRDRERAGQRSEVGVES